LKAWKCFTGWKKNFAT